MLGQTRLQTALISVFGLAAVALAVIGLYGLVALTVTTHRREIGIRMALGAAARRVIRELVASVTWLVAGGAVAGLLLTVMARWCSASRRPIWRRCSVPCSPSLPRRHLLLSCRPSGRRTSIR